MTYYTQQVTREVGMGNILFFATEQHPKKKENRVGTLTIQVYKHKEKAESPTKMLLKCCNVAPILTGTISREYSNVSCHQDALRRHINMYLCRQYGNSSAGGCSAVVPALSDSLYVLAVEMAPGEVGSTEQLSPWESGTATSDGGGGGSARGSGMVNSTSNRTSSSMVHIKFCRVEDVPMIMQACRVFFRQVSSSGGGQMKVEFPRGQMPMWWKLANEDVFDFKKTRETFSNVEVVEQFRERSGCHFSTCFSFDDSDVLVSSRVRTHDGTGWIPVVYVDLLKLMMGEMREIKRRRMVALEQELCSERTG